MSTTIYQSIVSGHITTVKLSACTQKMLYACSCCAGRLHQGGIEAACHLCRRLILFTLLCFCCGDYFPDSSKLRVFSLR